MKEKILLFKNVMMTLCLIAVCWTSASASTLQGDVDGSGHVNVKDVSVLINYLLTNDATAIVMENSDVDGDGAVNVKDVSSLIAKLLLAPDDGHEWVDLNLPSGTLWARCNVGANAPEEYGDYFAWGETAPKDNYGWSTYKWCNGSESTLTKYCTDGSYGTVDYKDELDLEDDAAYVNWGSSWRTPSKEQVEELLDYCIWTSSTLNDVSGVLVTASNGNTLFLPIAGEFVNDLNYFVGYFGFYMTRTLYEINNNSSYGLYFASGGWNINQNYRYAGQSLRPVRVPQN